MLRALATMTWLLGLLLAGVRCGTPVEGIAVLVNVANMPPQAQKVLVQITVNSKVNTDQPALVIPPGSTSFAVGLTEGTAGTVQIQVDVVGDDGCLTVTGSTSLMLMTGVRRYDTSVDLVPSSACLLSIDVTGDGSVRALLPGGLTPLCTSPCTLRADRNAVVSLTGAVGFASTAGAWGGACTGDISTPCSVTLAAGRSVTASFAPRTCSPDGVCLFPMPAGASVRTVLAVSSSGSTVTSVLAAGVGLYSNSAASPYTWSAVPNNLGTNPINSISQNNNITSVIYQNGQFSVSGNGYNLFSPITLPAGFGNVTGQDRRAGRFVVSDAGKVATIGSTTGTTVYTASAPLYAVEDNSSTNSTYVAGQGVWATKDTGGAWIPVQPVPTTKTIYGLYLTGFGTNPGYAVGEGGMILQLRNGAWTVVDPGDGRTLRALWTDSGGSRLWAAGDGGVIRFYTLTQGTKTLSAPTSPAPPNFTSVTGDSSSRQVWFAGPGSAIYGLKY